MDELVAQFSSITAASPAKASQYLQLADGNLEQAIQLFFESDGALDLPGDAPSNPPPRTSGSAQPPAGPNDVMVIDSSDDEDTGGVSRAVRSRPDEPRGLPAHRNPYSAFDTGDGDGDHEDEDEAMARRLQEEMYGGGAGQGDFEQSVRAPMARTAETLVGGPGDWRNEPDAMTAAIAEQIRTRSTRHARPGIFNQQHISPSIWEESSEEPVVLDSRRRDLSRATAGASEKSSKSGMLAEMYRPPVELISPLDWDGLRSRGKEEEKWILVDVQDPAIFDCQILNRDIWKNAEIKETVRENFLFKQYAKDDPAGQSYITYYFQAHESQDAYPHVAIVDPRTGEQVKVWSGPPGPKPIDFLMQLHEFLDRYSLKAFAKNPVAKRKPETRKEMDVSRLTEDEALQLAMQNSLKGQTDLRPDDPDDLTRSVELGQAKGKGKARATPLVGDGDHTPPLEISSDGEDEEEDEDEDENEEAADRRRYLSPTPAATNPLFAGISAFSPHTEPAADPATTTRIQFRHSGGRIVRRFGLAEPVRRIYEWLKADPMDGKSGVEFELIFMSKNLIDSLDVTIEEAGLKNGSIMVELHDNDA